MKVIIADDHGVLRDTLELYFDREPDMTARTAEDLDSAIRIIHEEGDFDLAVLDYNMPGMRGLDEIETFKKKTGVGAVAIISGTERHDMARDVINAGACGFLPKTMGAKSMVNAIRFMSMGEIFLPPDLAKHNRTTEANPFYGSLSNREIDVLRGIVHGKSNRQIADDLDIKETTVKLHVKTLYRKMNVSNRTQAAMAARDKDFS